MTTRTCTDFALSCFALHVLAFPSEGFMSGNGGIAKKQTSWRPLVTTDTQKKRGMYSEHTLEVARRYWRKITISLDSGTSIDIICSDCFCGRAAASPCPP